MIVKNDGTWDEATWAEENGSSDAICLTAFVVVMLGVSDLEGVVIMEMFKLAMKRSRERTTQVVKYVHVGRSEYHA